MKPIFLIAAAAVALSACTRPSPVVAGCFLRYVPPPESPFSSSGSTPPTISLPNPHNCLLTLPSSIVDGGSISIAPEAYAAARVRS